MVVGCWAVLVTVTGQATAWLVDQVQLTEGLTGRPWQSPLASALTAALVAVPAALLALLPRRPSVRAAGGVWAVSAAALALLGLLRTVPISANELYLALLTVAAGLAGLVVQRVTGTRGTVSPTGSHTSQPAGTTSPAATASTSAVRALAAAAGLVLLLPWLWLGALGGLLETVLAATAALAVGNLAAAVLGGRYWAAYGARPDGERHPVRVVLLGGLTAGVALSLLVAGVGQLGSQLAALLVVPPAAFTVGALQQLTIVSGRQPGPVPVRWVVGLAVFGPLAFVDPEEITFALLTSRDVPYWTGVASVVGLVLALLLGAATGLTSGRRRARMPRTVSALVAVGAVLVAATAVYAAPGQPGLHGERLFVVLTEQAKLDTLPDRGTGQARKDLRTREVYRRLVETAERTQAGLRAELRRKHLAHTPYYLVNAIEVSGGPVVRAWLARRPEVDRVLVVQRLRPLPAEVPTAHGSQPEPATPPWHLEMLRAGQVWSELGVTGAGITVGNSDSGVDGSHPALVANFRGGDDSWYDPWNGSRRPTDHNGHGTHTTGSAVGSRNIGVAPGARWVGCVNLDRNLGNPAYYLDCMQFMFAPFPPGGDPFTDGRPERAPQVLTNSWSCPSVEGCDRDVFRPATAVFHAVGTFVVAAAGNTGPYCGSIDEPPGAYADVFTVGAVDQRRRVTEFSSRGSVAQPGKPDVVAPGAGVLSAMPGGGYAATSGTSMATPLVAGLVALMWSADPALIGQIGTTERILEQTARPAVPTYRSRAPADACGSPANITGAGIVDAYAAVHVVLDERS